MLLITAFFRKIAPGARRVRNRTIPGGDCRNSYYIQAPCRAEENYHVTI